MRFFISGLAPFNLLAKALVLIHRIIELGESVGYLASGNEKFKPFSQIRILITAP
jgi:hypothetical protein